MYTPLVVPLALSFQTLCKDVSYLPEFFYIIFVLYVGTHARARALPLKHTHARTIVYGKRYEIIVTVRKINFNYKQF